MGSTSDLPVVEKACKWLREQEIPFEMDILSAHRISDIIEIFAKGTKGRDVKVIIVTTGMAAALPGTIAASTPPPVIGVPIGGILDGLDALLPIVQVPPGILIVTVGVNGAQNAAILAAETITFDDEAIAKEIDNWETSSGKKIEEASRELIELKDYKFKC